MTSSITPLIPLNNGVQLPALGFGVYRSAPEQTGSAVTPGRIAENFDVFGFRLTSDEVGTIDALDTGMRGGPDPERIDTKLYTLTIPA
jgi:diketogulonate reductase-like aldo/keto reductase